MSWRDAPIVEDAGKSKAKSAAPEHLPKGWKSAPVVRKNQRGPFDRFARGAGNVLADTAGLPVGAAMELGNLTGVTDFENTSGSDFLKRQLEPLGLTGAPGEDLGIAGQAGQAFGIGGTLGAGAMGAAGRTAAPAVERGIGGISSIMQGKLPSTTQRAIEAIGRPAVSRPGTVGSAEFGAGAAAGATAGIAAEEFGEDSWQAAIADLTGGIAGGAATAGTATGAIKLTRSGLDLAGNTLVGQGVAAAGRLFGIQTPGAGRPRAAKRLSSVAGHPGDARRNLEGVGTDEVDEDLLTVPQQTGDTGIMRIGAKTRADDEATDRLDQWRAGAERTTSEIINRINTATGVEGADPDQAVRALRESSAAAQQASEDMVAAATANAARAIDNLDPSAPPEEAARLVRSNLDSALSNVRAQESALWNANPYKDHVVTADNLDSRFSQYLDEAGDDVMSTVPTSVRRFLGNVEEPEAPTQFLDSRGRPMPTETPPPATREATFEELQTMRSELLRDARAYRRGASPDYNRARINEGLADAIADDFMDSGSGLPPEGQEIFNAARQFTSWKNKTFRQGAVGKVLRTGPDSGPMVEPEMTLNSMFGRGARELRGVNARQLGDAVGDNPEVWGAVDDYMRFKFNEKAVKDGEINRAAAENFIRDNEGVLTNRPELRDQIDNAIRTGERLATSRASSSQLAKDLNDPTINRAEIFLRAAGDESVDTAARRVLSTANSREAVRDIKSQLGKDRTGEALRGFKKSVTDEIVGSAMLKGDGQTAPSQYLDGQRLRSIFAGPDASPDGVPAEVLRIRRAVNELYSPEELGRLRTLANTAARVQQDVAAQKRPAERIMDDSTGRLLEFSSRVLGARIGGAAGGAVGGGNIQSPGAGADLLSNMVKRGVTDPGRKMIVDAIDGKRLPGRGGERGPLLMDVLLKGYRREPLSPAQTRSLAAYIEAIGPELDEGEDR